MTTQILLELDQNGFLICPTCGNRDHRITGVNLMAIGDFSDVELQITGGCGHRFLLSLVQDDKALQMNYIKDIIHA